MWSTWFAQLLLNFIWKTNTDINQLGRATAKLQTKLKSDLSLAQLSHSLFIHDDKNLFLGALFVDLEWKESQKHKSMQRQLLIQTFLKSEGKKNQDERNSMLRSVLGYQILS